MNKQIHLKAVSLVAALLAAILTVFGLGMSALPASAADLTDADISISTESVVSGQWDQVDLSCEWSVPDYSKPGDTFSLQLPAQLRWFGAATFNLNSPGGETVATAEANDAGLVIFTLTDFVASHPLNVGGTCSFTTQYSMDPGDSHTEELIFTVGSKVIRVPVVTEPCISDCEPGLPTEAVKSMRWVDSAQSELESIFSMPPMPAETNDVVITDTPGDGMEIDCARVTPRVGQVVSPAGNIIEPFDNEQYPATIECTPQELTVSWVGLPEGEHVELFVVTTVTDPAREVYENSGTVSIAGKGIPVGSELRRSVAGGTGDGSAEATATPTPTTATPTPTPTTATPTPTPTPTTAAPSPSMTPTPTPSTTSPAVVVPTEAPSEPAPTATPAEPAPVETPAEDTGQLADTGAQGSVFVFVAAALLAVGSLLAFAGARWSGRRSH